MQHPNIIIEYINFVILLLIIVVVVVFLLGPLWQRWLRCQTNDQKIMGSNPFPLPLHSKVVKHGSVRGVRALSVDLFCVPMNSQAVCSLGS